MSVCLVAGIKVGYILERLFIDVPTIIFDKNRHFGSKQLVVPDRQRVDRVIRQKDDSLALPEFHMDFITDRPPIQEAAMKTDFKSFMYCYFLQSSPTNLF